MIKERESRAKEKTRGLLLQWWGKNKRAFPWRRKKDPYAILISEMLLRKTTSKQVEKMFVDFIKKYPNPKVLSEADENELIKLLKPLGMEYHRAKLFVRFGRTIVENFGGRIPFSKNELLKLPGVGLYATNAVLSFSFNRNVPMVDTNFIRIIERVFDFKSSKSRARNDNRIWEYAQDLIPEGKSREFNLAILDFAALICIARIPKCSICPIINICDFNRKKKLEVKKIK